MKQRGKTKTGNAARQRRSGSRAAPRTAGSRPEAHPERPARQGKARKQRLAKPPPPLAAGQLAGFIAHELRQPLSVISNVVSYLQATLSSADRSVARNLRLIQQQTDLAGRTLSSMIQYARAGSPRPVAMDLGAAAAESLAGVRKPRAIRCRLQVPRRLPPALADPGHVECILSNLIRNALESICGAGAVSLTVRAKGDQVLVEVTDTGCGVRSDLKEKIFEQFFSTKGGGTGLGLALCRQLAEANGGTVLLQDRRGKGSTFELHLPRA